MSVSPSSSLADPQAVMEKTERNIAALRKQQQEELAAVLPKPVSVNIRLKVPQGNGVTVHGSITYGPEFAEPVAFHRLVKLLVDAGYPVSVTRESYGYNNRAGV